MCKEEQQEEIDNGRGIIITWLAKLLLYIIKERFVNSGVPS